MRKKLTSGLMAALTVLLLCMTLCVGASAVAVTSSFPEDGIFVPTTYGYLLINEKHKLYFYRVDGAKVTSAKITDNAKKVTDTPEAAFVLKTDGTVVGYNMVRTWEGATAVIRYENPKLLISGIQDIFSSPALSALGNDGTLTVFYRPEYYLPVSGPAFWNTYNREVVDTGVEYLVDDRYLKNNTEYKVVADDYTTVDGKRGISYGTRLEKTLKVPDVKKDYGNFVLTKNGEFWGWGEGNCGNLGGRYTWDHQQTVPHPGGLEGELELPLILEHYDPVRILTNVESFHYFPFEGNYAIKTDGSVWKWGDAEPVTAILNGRNWLSTHHPDYDTWAPRREPFPESITVKDGNKIYTVYADGRLTYQVADYSTFPETLSPVRSLPNWKSAATAPVVTPPAVPTTDATMAKENLAVKEAVAWALENGITTGYADGCFHPSATCTRGQVATFLWRSHGCPEPKTKVNPFTDVSPTSPFYKAILWAYENGITTGTTDTTFSPNKTCTGAHVVTFLYRSEGQPGSHGGGANYYTEAVEWATEHHLLEYTGRNFDVSTPSARANIVVYLYRLHC